MNEDVVLKFFADAHFDGINAFEKEMFIYKLFSSSPRVLEFTTRLIDDHSHGLLRDLCSTVNKDNELKLERWPFVILKAMQGQSIRSMGAQLSHSDLIQLAAKLGEQVRLLHGMEVHDLAINSGMTIPNDLQKGYFGSFLKTQSYC